MDGSLDGFMQGHVIHGSMEHWGKVVGLYPITLSVGCVLSLIIWYGRAQILLLRLSGSFWWMMHLFLLGNGLQHFHSDSKTWVSLALVFCRQRLRTCSIMDSFVKRWDWAQSLLRFCFYVFSMAMGKGGSYHYHYYIICGARTIHLRTFVVLTLPLL